MEKTKRSKIRVVMTIEQNWDGAAMVDIENVELVSGEMTKEFAESISWDHDIDVEDWMDVDFSEVAENDIDEWDDDPRHFEGNPADYGDN